MKVPVLIPRIFDHPHTYLSGKFGKLKAGSIVQVPFGKENEIGVVWDKAQETKKNFQIKTISEIKPFSFSDKLINFINWFSIYNLVPKGMVLKMFLEMIYYRLKILILNFNIAKIKKLNLN